MKKSIAHIVEQKDYSTSKKKLDEYIVWFVNITRRKDNMNRLDPLLGDQPTRNFEEWRQLVNHGLDFHGEGNNIGVTFRR